MLLQEYILKPTCVKFLEFPSTQKYTITIKIITRSHTKTKIILSIKSSINIFKIISSYETSFTWLTPLSNIQDSPMNSTFNLHNLHSTHIMFMNRKFCQSEFAVATVQVISKSNHWSCACVSPSSSLQRENNWKSKRIKNVDGWKPRQWIIDKQTKAP
jgi:hypothetical protein